MPRVETNLSATIETQPTCDDTLALLGAYAIKPNLTIFEWKTALRRIDEAEAQLGADLVRIITDT